MTISSIIVQTTAEKVEQVVEMLKKSELCEYHLHDEKGRIIITIEGENTGQEMEKLSIIQELDNIISAEMHYSYNEDELEQMRDNLDMAEVPEWLNDKNIKAEEIEYHGDLKKKKRFSF